MNNDLSQENYVLFHFGTEQYRTYNVNIAKIIGLEEAIILNDLIDQYKYFKSQNKLIQIDGEQGQWFYYSHKTCEFRTAIREESLRRIVKNLKRQNLIIYINKGVPQKRHFKLNFEEIFQLSKKDSKTVENTFQSVENPVLHDIYKEPNNESNKTTTQSSSNDFVPEQKSSSSIFKSLKISAVNQKRMISKYTTEQLEQAIKRAMAWEGRQSDEAALWYALENADTWNDILSQEDLIQENQEFLKDYQHLDMKTINGVYVVISNQGIEFSYGQAQKFFKIDSKNFQKDVKDYLNKINLRE